MEQERFPGTEKEEHSIFPMFCDDWGHDLIWKERRLRLKFLQVEIHDRRKLRLFHKSIDHLSLLSQLIKRNV